MLETSPRGTSKVSLHRMEIHVHLGGEKLRYNLEGAYRGVRGRTSMTEYHGGLLMELSKGTRDQAPLLTIRTETNNGSPNKGLSSTNRFWRLRPDGLAFRLPTKTSAGTLCILEFKRMSDVTDQYLTRTRSRVQNQYGSLKWTFGVTLQYQG